MIKYSKFISFILVIGLFTLMLAGCQPKEVNQEEPKEVKTAAKTDSEKEEKIEEPAFENMELNVAAFEGGYGREFWDRVCANFEAAYPGVKVNLEANPKIGELIRPKMLSGDSPDFIYLNDGDSSGLTQGLIKDKGIMDITDVFEEMALDQDVPLKDLINDGFLETKKMSPYDDGKVYLAPFNYTVLGLWYNKNLFDTKGWEAPRTWDELYAFNDKAKADGRSLFTYQGIYPSYLEIVIQPSIASKGGMDAVNAVFNYEPDAWESEAAIESANVLQTIAEEGYLLDGTIAMNHTQAQTEFLLGHALFCPNGTWFEGEMKDAPREDGFEYGFIGAPVFDKDDQMYVVAGIEQLYIPKASKNPELAKEFLKFLYTDESVLLNAETSKGVMAVKGAVEKVKDYIPVSSYNAYGIFDREGAKPLVLNFATVPETVNVIYGEALYDPISDIMNGDLTADQWRAGLAELNQEITDAK